MGSRRPTMDRRPLLTGLAFLLVMGLLACLPWQPSPQGALVYAGPSEQSIPAGDFLPGTEIQYVRMTEEGAELLIEGQRAVKKKGDSLDWDGHPLPGVTLTLRQRIVWFTEEKLHVAGAARLTIREPQPTPISFPEDLPVIYKLPVSYNVKRGERIPGTTIGYVGSTEKGAELDGIEGYPYRRIADSILWEGKLLEGAFLKLTIRVAFFNDEQLQVVGLATIGLIPEGA